MTDEFEIAPERTIQFVCQHGAFRSRIAAAYFDALAPSGWSAVSGGVTPQTEVSERLRPTLEGTEGEPFIDDRPPQVAMPGVAIKTVAIDADLAFADDIWRTSGGESLSDEELRDEIKRSVEQLIRDLPETPAV